MLGKDFAVEWVDKNKHRIRGRATKFAKMSPYDTEDFLQDAYEAALLADEVSARKNIDFERCFWVSYKRITCSKVTEVMTQSDFEIEELPGGDDPCFELLVMEELQTERNKLDPQDLISKILDGMSPKAREAWEYTLKGYTPKEVGNILGIRRQSVMKRKELGIRKAKEKGGFNELCKV